MKSREEKDRRDRKRGKSMKKKENEGRKDERRKVA